MSDDTAEDVSNFELVRPGDRLEILWSVAGLFFPCSVISYTSKQVASQQGSANKTPNASTQLTSNGYAQSGMYRSL